MLKKKWRRISFLVQNENFTSFERKIAQVFGEILSHSKRWPSDSAKIWGHKQILWEKSCFRFNGFYCNSICARKSCTRVIFMVFVQSNPMDRLILVYLCAAKLNENKILQIITATVLHRHRFNPCTHGIHTSAHFTPHFSNQA